MAEEEHEVYGGEIPEEAEYEAEGEAHPADGGVGGGTGGGGGAVGAGGGEGALGNPSGDDGNPEDATTKELEEMKKRLKEMEDEAAALREMQARVEKEMGALSDPSGANQANKEEADARSVFVGNVDYACTPEEVQQHFQSCGTVNRVTILTDKFGHPKGFAYVEFLELEAVQNAILLNESELHGRPLKVVAKRTNVPGMKMGGRFRRSGAPYPYFRPRRPFGGPAAFSGYGRVPRFRRPVRYRPYF